MQKISYLTLDLKRLSLSWLGKHPLGSGFHKSSCSWKETVNGTISLLMEHKGDGDDSS